MRVKCLAQCWDHSSVTIIITTTTTITVISTIVIPVTIISIITISTTLPKMVRVAVGSEFRPQPCLTFPTVLRGHPSPSPTPVSLPPQCTHGKHGCCSTALTCCHNSNHTWVCSALQFSKQFHKTITADLLGSVLCADPIPMIGMPYLPHPQSEPTSG